MVTKQPRERFLGVLGYDRVDGARRYGDRRADRAVAAEDERVVGEVDGVGDRRAEEQVREALSDVEGLDVLGAPAAPKDTENGEPVEIVRCSQRGARSVQL